jgi:fatty acid desaturase
MRALPAGSLWQRARALAADPATWKDLAYLVLLGPLGLVWFVLTSFLWSVAIVLLTAPLWFWVPPAGPRPTAASERARRRRPTRAAGGSASP